MVSGPHNGTDLFTARLGGTANIPAPGCTADKPCAVQIPVLLLSSP
jgi:hypothetical protein